MTQPSPSLDHPALPGPAEPVTVAVACRVGPNARSVRHPVTFGVDWSVMTPHDPLLEQIAAALGGGASCLPMIGAALAGLRLWWARVHRAVPAPIRSPDRGRSWNTTDTPQSCCPRSGFPEAIRAAAHAREPRHIARGCGSDPRQLATLARGLAAVAFAAPPASGEHGALVRQGWECGMPPSWVARACQAVAEVFGDSTDPGLGFLLALASSGSDPGWAARSCAAVSEPGAELLAWVAWTMTDLDHEQDRVRGGWLVTGSRRADIVALSEAGYASEQAIALAGGWGLSVPGAAKLLAGWVTNGYRPTVGQLNELRDFGHAYPPAAPASAAVARIAEHLGHRDPPDATGYALALARRGTVPGAISELQGRQDQQ